MLYEGDGGYAGWEASRKEEPVHERGKKELGNRIFTWSSIILNIVLIMTFTISAFKQPEPYIVQEPQVVERIIERTDTVEIQAVQPVSDTEFVFHKIPTDSLLRYAEFSSAVPTNDAGRYAFEDVQNQQRWAWLRAVFDNEFEPYEKNGVLYTWCVVRMNSNTICVANTYGFDLGKEGNVREFVKYRASLNK